MLPLLFSCETNRFIEFEKLELDFPEVPELEWYEKTTDDKQVTVPAEWFINIAIYVLEVEEQKKKYELYNSWRNN